MALPQDHPDYIPKEPFAEAVRKYLLPGYIAKLRRDEEARISAEADGQPRINDAS